MNKKIGAAMAALTFSAPALADIELGGHTGYTIMTLSEGDGSFSGTSFGFRAGMGVGLGLTPEINVTQYSGSESDGDESLSLSQLQTGLGARFYIGDFFLRPFASGHLLYATPATQSLSKGNSESSGLDIAGSGGLGVDFGAGLQMKFLDLIYGELQGTYARTLSDMPLNTIYIAVGLGVKL